MCITIFSKLDLRPARFEQNVRFTCKGKGILLAYQKKRKGILLIPFF